MTKHLRTVVFLAICIALVALGTMVFRINIPATNGYMNLGDSVIFAVAIALGRRYGLIAGGLGSALADILGGYPAWAPWTLVIKGIEGYIAGALCDDCAEAGTRSGLFKIVVATLLAGAWMVAGYFIAGAILYGFSGALGELPFNLVQAGGSIVIASVLAPAIRSLRPVLSSSSLS